MTMVKIKRTIYDNKQVIGYIIETLIGKDIIIVSKLDDNVRNILKIRKTDEENIIVDKHVVDVLSKAIDK